jgi:hypothetical protein
MCRIDAFGRTSVQGNVEGGNGSDGEVKQERKEEDNKNRNYYGKLAVARGSHDKKPCLMACISVTAV